MILAICVLLLVLAVVLFVNFSPQFGAAPSGDHLARISASDNYSGDEFVNLTETSLDYSFTGIMTTLWEFITVSGISPEEALPVRLNEQQTAPESDTLVYVTWYGHSAFLLEMEGRRILLDPMLGPVAGPLPFLSGRFEYQEALDLESFRDIDAVILSHDHYDHLDYPSILHLKDNAAHFYAPLGLGAHLQRWGVPAEKITELDWWESAQLNGLTFIATPARHFSGRGLTDGNKTQWASWVVQGKYNNIYFSGDSGYGDHFKQIGEAYGPFDFTMLECGQYNKKWEAIHMMPEQCVQANVDLRGELMMPIHWGAFSLALHHWQEPVERLLAAAGAMQVATPYIGQRFAVGQQIPSERWWKQLR